MVLSKYYSLGFNDEQLFEIAKGLNSGVDVTLYANIQRSPTDMKDLRILLKAEDCEKPSVNLIENIVESIREQSWKDIKDTFMNLPIEHLLLVSKAEKLYDKMVELRAFDCLKSNDTLKAFINVYWNC